MCDFSTPKQTGGFSSQTPSPAPLIKFSAQTPQWRLRSVRSSRAFVWAAPLAFLRRRCNLPSLPSQSECWQGCGIKGFLPTSVIQGNPPLYEENSLWEALSVVSQKWSFPTALECCAWDPRNRFGCQGCICPLNSRPGCQFGGDRLG